MAIDDPKAAFEQQYMRQDQESPLELALLTGELAFPKAALLAEIFLKVKHSLSRPALEERLGAMWTMLVMETEHLKTTKANAEDIQAAIQLALRRDAEESNNEKRQRYVKLIGNALRSDTQLQDVTTFVQTIERLNERDVTVLKVLNKIMNKENDWKPEPPNIGSVRKLLPTTLTSRAQELAVQIAMALGQKTEGNSFNREEGYTICTRLQGLGLAHEVGASPRDLPLTNYSFRLSAQGIRLLKLLGEHVPNFDNYFSD